MKFQVNRDALSEAVSFAVRMLPQKKTLPILNAILIEADANAIRLSVYDHEVSARVEIDYINEHYPINLPESEEYDTLGGLITYRLERIPEKDTTLDLNTDIRLVIEEVSERRIEKVRLFIR